MSKQAKALNEAQLTYLMPNVMIGHGLCQDMDALVPGIFYVTSSTLNIPQGSMANGIVENVFTSSRIVLQRLTERTYQNAARIFTRVYWLDSWGPWAVTKYP